MYMTYVALFAVFYISFITNSLNTQRVLTKRRWLRTGPNRQDHRSWSVDRTSTNILRPQFRGLRPRIPM